MSNVLFIFKVLCINPDVFPPNNVAYSTKRVVLRMRATPRESVVLDVTACAHSPTLVYSYYATTSFAQRSAREEGKRKSDSSVTGESKYSRAAWFLRLSFTCRGAHAHEVDSFLSPPYPHRCWRRIWPASRVTLPPR